MRWYGGGCWMVALYLVGGACALTLALAVLSVALPVFAIGALAYVLLRLRKRSSGQAVKDRMARWRWQWRARRMLARAPAGSRGQLSRWLNAAEAAIAAGDARAYGYAMQQAARLAG